MRGVNLNMCILRMLGDAFSLGAAHIILNLFLRKQIGPTLNIRTSVLLLIDRLLGKAILSMVYLLLKRNLF